MDEGGACKVKCWADAHSAACVWGLCGDPVSQYASFVITARSIREVGYFDENFWPAYGEVGTDVAGVAEG